MQDSLIQLSWKSVTFMAFRSVSHASASETIFRQKKKKRKKLHKKLDKFRCKKNQDLCHVTETEFTELSKWSNKWLMTVRTCLVTLWRDFVTFLVWRFRPTCPLVGGRSTTRACDCWVSYYTVQYKNRRLDLCEVACFNNAIMTSYMNSMKTCNSVTFYFMKKLILWYQQEVHFTKYN